MSQSGYTPIQLYRTTTAAAAPSAGNLAAGELAINTTDEKLYFKNTSGTVKLLASSAGASGTVTSVDVSGGTTGLSFSGGPVTSSGTITMAGTLAVGNGGTGQTSYTDGQLLIGNSTGNTLAKATLTAGTGVSITNGSGSITISATGSGGTVTSVAASGGTTGLTFSGSPITSSGTLTLGGTLGVSNGGTGLTAAPTNGQLLIGNGTNYTLAALTQGTGITITNASGAITVTNSAPMTYPGAGIAVSTGSAWGTSLTAPSGTIVGTTDTQTLTNKRINPRVSSATSASSLTPNSDNFDQYAYTALAANLTIAADSGTPVDGQKITFRVTCDATPRVLTFTGGTSKGFRPVGVTMTVSGSNFTYTATASKTVYIGCVYNTNASRWDIVALSQEA